MLDPINLPEVIFSSPENRISKQISKLNEEGKIKKLAPRLYTSNLLDEPTEIVRRNLFLIIANLYPGSILSHRSALEVRPTSLGNMYLTYKYTKNIKLPGITLKFLDGPERQDSDNPLTGELYLSSLERACLENLQVSRKTSDGERRTIDPEVLENRLVNILRIEGESGINKFRDKAKSLASKLDMEKEFEKLNSKVSALLSTKPADILKSPQAIAASLGRPYDPHRIDLFWKLFAALKNTPFPYREEKKITSEAFTNFAFFEAYFSNYIEGTEFEIEQARDIVFKGLFIENRVGDTHDIKGTFEIVGNQFEMRKTPGSFEQFLSLLKSRHAVILRERPDKRPGAFKAKVNKAGNTTFVEPPLVVGTLNQAFEPYQALDHPFAKAVFMMFVISEVHPFEDGNGRIARIMMNAELVNAQLQRIIIPTVFREDYLLSLRKLTRKQIPDAYIKMLDRIQEFSAWLKPDVFEEMSEQLELSNAFLEPSEGKLIWPKGQII